MTCAAAIVLLAIIQIQVDHVPLVVLVNINQMESVTMGLLIMKNHVWGYGLLCQEKV
jgi:hypothetical protein